MLHEAVIVAYGRSPVCRAFKGALAQVHPVDYAAETLKGVLAQVPQLNPEEISDLVLGCSMPVKTLNLNVARQVVQRAQLPDSISAQTINRYCASSLQAIATCANAIMCGQEEVMIAGGVEDMTHTFHTADPKERNPWLNENCEGAYISMGLTAENVAAKHGVQRADMEAMAVESHAKAAAAQDNGYLDMSIIPVKGKDAEGNEITVTKDEGIRRGTNAEKLATLKPCFKEDGVVTAATSSQTSDAAAFAVVMSREKAEQLGIKPIARFVAFAVAGCDGRYMGEGPIYAVPKVMEKAGLSIDDMDVIELNEAFAAQALVCIDQLNLPKEKLNPWGGAMALGHPMGATGIFLMSKALDYLKVTGGKKALVTMCIGGGMGAAGIFEMC
ncbi:MAG: thiolase family protein [Anaerovoracaceae bacterium]